MFNKWLPVALRFTLRARWSRRHLRMTWRVLTIFDVPSISPCGPAWDHPERLELCVRKRNHHRRSVPSSLASVSEKTIPQLRFARNLEQHIHQVIEVLIRSIRYLQLVLPQRVALHHSAINVTLNILGRAPFSTRPVIVMFDSQAQHTDADSTINAPVDHH
jgi:hypothetical protein